MERPYSEEKKSTSIKFCWGCGHNFDVDEWRFVLDNDDELCDECFNDAEFKIIKEDIEVEA